MKLKSWNLNGKPENAEGNLKNKLGHAPNEIPPQVQAYTFLLLTTKCFFKLKITSYLLLPLEAQTCKMKIFRVFEGVGCFRNVARLHRYEKWKMHLWTLQGALGHPLRGWGMSLGWPLLIGNILRTSLCNIIVLTPGI